MKGMPYAYQKKKKLDVLQFLVTVFLLFFGLCALCTAYNAFIHNARCTWGLCFLNLMCFMMICIRVIIALGYPLNLSLIDSTVDDGFCWGRRRADASKESREHNK